MLRISLLDQADASDPWNCFLTIGWRVWVKKTGKCFGGKITVKRRDMQPIEVIETCISALVRDFILNPPPDDVLDAIRNTSIGGKALPCFDLDSGKWPAEYEI